MNPNRVGNPTLTMYGPAGRSFSGCNPGTSGIVQLNEYFKPAFRPASAYDNELMMSEESPAVQEQDTGRVARYS